METQETEVKKSKDSNERTENNLGHKLSSTGWALFFIWIGIAFIAKFTIGIGMLGIGIITLGIQAARKSYNLKVEGFWLIIGLLFVLGGAGKAFEVKIPIVPIVFILAGLALLYSIFKGKR